MKNLYKINNLVKSYDGRIVLNLKEFSLEKGRIIGLLGPNGAGKTTLLEILAFLMPPSEGSVWFGNEAVDFNSVRLINLRHSVVLVQQQPILFTTTVYRNVEFPLKIRGIPKSERHGMVQDLLNLVGMEPFKTAKAHNLSGGETQRVALAQALACSPKVILLDEPTASVDVENQIAIEHIIQEINRQRGISIILTTHDMIQASRLSDEIVFMLEGTVTESIYENIFRAHVETDSFGRKYCVVQEGFKLFVNDEKTGPVRVTINPNQVRLCRKGGSEPGENSFKGRLIQLTDEHRWVRALVDVGVPLGLLIPKEHVGTLQLEIGKDIWVKIPPESIEIL